MDTNLIYYNHLYRIFMFENEIFNRVWVSVRENYILMQKKEPENKSELFLSLLTNDPLPLHLKNTWNS